ncbi:MAG: hypothetical protein WA821_02095 [Anaerolineales bacterium]
MNIRSISLRLFLLSFLILFLELVCIRWLSAYVLYLGYFTNFVLLGCFLGIGAGSLLANHRIRFLGFLPPLLCVFFAVILFSRAQVDPSFDGLIYFTSTSGAVSLPPYILLPLIFIGITAIFTFLAQDLGVLFNQFAPLEAYRLNILGSLAGIVCFALMGLLSAPAWTWFLIASVMLFFLLPMDWSRKRNLVALVALVAVIAISDYRISNVWSPYSRLNILATHDGLLPEIVNPFNSQDKAKPGYTYLVTANGIGQQAFTPISTADSAYGLPYTAFAQKPAYKNILVIGAGGGNDVAFALANGVEHVDAVEIDPETVRLGRMYHPESPYSDPRVSIYIDDGRAFLEHSKQKYDLIIFALTDSFVLASNSSNLRLESYLFTTESFERARSLLKPDGLFMLYNYYRYDWLVDKIAYMLKDVFGKAPVYHRPGNAVTNSAVFVTFFVGPKAADINIQQPDFYQSNPQPVTPATDNWPFLYLSQPSIPPMYLLTLLIVLVGSGLFIWRISPRGALTQGSLPFFFMGAAFSLLETKSIVNFLLLFGATWLVNALVFFGVLLIVLIAIWLSSRFKFKKTWLLYVILFATIALNFFVPLKMLLVDDLTVRYLLAILLLFSPIFVANLIYSSAFRDVSQANVAFGANLLGTIVGGGFEYLSLYTGYQVLSLLAGVFYLGAFIFFIRLQRKAAAPTAHPFAESR